MGKPGVIDIEREADFSGRTHVKGVLILSGYLGRVVRAAPAARTSRSASPSSRATTRSTATAPPRPSSTRSSPASPESPLKQGIAVTGSVNQKGRIQAVGGVNQKIEGFFDVCREKGITGDQGVIIPAANARNLMLRKDVTDAVAERKFHVYRVWSVEEAIGILTGVPPDARTPRAATPPRPYSAPCRPSCRPTLSAACASGKSSRLHHRCESCAGPFAGPASAGPWPGRTANGRLVTEGVRCFVPGIWWLP